LYLHPIRFGKWGELMGRTQRFFRFRTLENLHKSRLFRVERSTKRFRFRVRAVITTSIPLRIYLKAFSSFLPVEWLWMEPEKSPEKGEKTRRERQKILSCECLKSPYKSRVLRRRGTKWCS